MRRSAVICVLVPVLCGAAAQNPSQNQPAAQTRQLLRNAATAQQRGDLKTAIEDFRKALALDPEID